MNQTDSPHKTSLSQRLPARIKRISQIFQRNKKPSPQPTLPIKISRLTQFRLSIRQRINNTNLALINRFFNKPLIILALTSSLFSFLILLIIIQRYQTSLPDQIYLLKSWEEITKGFITVKTLMLILATMIALQIVILGHILFLFRKGHRHLYYFIAILVIISNFVIFIQINLDLSKFLK